MIFLSEEMEEPLLAGAGHGPEEAAAILVLVKEVGLEGQRLALQKGDEAGLTRQIAERLGKVPQTWMLEYITNLVNSAVATEDMEKRLGGSMARPGVQVVWDAVEARDGRRHKPPRQLECVSPVGLLRRHREERG